MLTNSKIALSGALVLATASAAVAAPKLNTTKIAGDLLGGPAQRVYYQDLTTQQHLKIDMLGAGDFMFVWDAGSPNPTHSYEKEGLLMSVDRPSIAADGSSWAAVNLHNITMPQRFVLTATFIEPNKVSLNQMPQLGQYAAALAPSFAHAYWGETSQFRDATSNLNPLTPGQRLNVPFDSIFRSDIKANLYNEVIDPHHPSPFTLVMYVERSALNSAANGKLFVGNKLADSVLFSFCKLTAATVFDNIQVGVSTAAGEKFRASVYITEFEIWVPNQP
jgi:hypothetical protein